MASQPGGLCSLPSMWLQVTMFMLSMMLEIAHLHLRQHQLQGDEGVLIVDR
jgi:hypothetical protein